MPDTPKLNAAFYGRYSDGPNQSESSIEGQRRECYAKAKAQNAIIRKDYIDRHISGQTDQRPQFQQLMKDAKKGLYNVIYVYTIDRFSRNKYDIAKYKNELRKAGCRLISAKEYIPAGPEGIILESVLEGMAEYYSKELSRKVSRGIYESALKFQHIGGVIPFGLILENKKYKPDPIKAPIVREIYERYVSGEPAVDICKSLNSRGITTSYNKKFNKSSLNRILSNPKYIGTYTYNRAYIDEISQQKKTEIIEFKNVIEPIISEELYLKAGKRMEQNKHTSKRSKDKPNAEFLLSGKLFCGKCKAPMTGDSGTSRNGASYFYYTCANKKSKRGRDKCRSKSYPKEKLETFIAQFTRDDILSPDVIEWLSNNIISLQGEQKDDIQIRLMQQQKKDIENKIANVMTAIENGIFTSTTKSRLEDLEEAQRNLEYNIQAEKFKNEAPAESKESIIYFLEQFRKGDIHDIECQRIIINSFIDTIIIDEENDRGIIAYRYTDEGNGTREFSLKNTFDVFECVLNGGPSWTRTRDLTLIRRTL